MSTYLINHLRTPGDVPRPGGPSYLEYLEEIQATLEPYGGKWLVQDSEVRVIEGAWPGSVVLIEFPGMREARDWYNSPAYQTILHKRTDHTVSDLIFVDGVGPDFTPAAYARQIRGLLANSGS